MEIQLPSQRMTLPKKLAAFQAIWNSHCSRPVEVTSLTWHEQVLAKRTLGLPFGEETVSRWLSTNKRLHDFRR